MVVQTKLSGAMAGFSTAKGKTELPTIEVPRLWRAGATVKQISEAVRMTPRDVQNILRASGDLVGHVGRVDFNWTPQAIEILKSMDAEGHSAAAIARALGGGVSRNAVIGKIARLGLRNGRPHRKPQSWARPAFAGPNLAKQPLQRPREPSMPYPGPLVLESGAFVTLHTVSDRTCRYPFGDPREEGFHFCGLIPRAIDAGGGVYCDRHAELCFAKASPAQS